MSPVAAAAATQQPHVLRAWDVARRVGVCRNTLYNWIADGTFPASHKIGKRAVGWNSAEIDAWLASRFGGGQ